MELKKIAAVILSCAVAGTVFTGCGETPPAQTQAEEIKMGLLQTLNADTDTYNKMMAKFEENAEIKLPHHQIIFYRNFQTLQEDLISGKIDEVSIYKSATDYLMARNPQIEIAKNHVGKKKIIDNIAFALRAEDTELKNSLDDAISKMQNDRTLDKLITIYITDFKTPEDLPAVTFENFDGADTIKVGVTGDLPPMDLILADGTPAGFNTALLSEIGKRLQKNIEFVKINSASRAAALTSKKVDISFWAIIPTNESVPLDLDKPEGVELSTPYFTDDVIHIDIKK